MVPHGHKTYIHGDQNTVSQYVTALKSCIRNKDFDRGKALHREAAEASVHVNKYVASLLIKLYSACGNMFLAQEVFDGTFHRDRDVVTWTCLILGYVENGESFEAVRLFATMDCTPSSVTYIAVLKAYASMTSEKALEKQTSLERVISIHTQVNKRGLDSDVPLSTTLLDVYSKCGSMHRARDVFEGMAQRNVITWTSLLLGYVGNGESLKALKLFMAMDCKPDSFTYVAVLKACGVLSCENGLRKEECLEMGMAMHRAVQERGCGSDVVLATAVVDMYCKCGRTHLAKEVFDGMIHRNVVTWTSLILGYVENGQSLVALYMFFRMDCEPDSFTYLTALKACSTLASERSYKEFSLEKGLAIHRKVKSSGLDADMLIATSILDVYGKCGNMRLARNVFDGMVHKDVVTWTSLLVGYLENEEYSVALEMFSIMDCEPNSFTYMAALKACGGLAGENGAEKKVLLEKGMSLHKDIQILELDSEVMVATSLVEMYSRCGCITYAREIFERMKDPNVVTWNSLMLGYVKNGESSTALDLFTNIACEPDSFTFVAALKACGKLAVLSFGKHVHAGALKRGVEEEEVVECSLMDFYVKCARISNAQLLFSNMHCPDAVSWNTLISGYSSAGASDQVFLLVKSMEEAGAQMNSVTLLCVLSACSHAGLVEEARVYFQRMLRCGICSTVEHYNCMVDVLCRANRLEEALVLASTMPLDSNAVTWTTLLTACGRWKSLQIGKVSCEKTHVKFI